MSTPNTWTTQQLLVALDSEKLLASNQQPTCTPFLNPLMIDLAPFSLAVVQSFYKVQPRVACPHCAVLGCMMHATNTNTAPPKPVFECCLCNKQPSLQEIEREVKIALAKPAAIPIATPTNLNFGTTDHNFRASNVPTSTNKKTRTPTANKATSVSSGSKRARRPTDDAGPTGTVLTNLESLVKALQDRINNMESENKSIKNQLQQAVNKNAALEQKILATERNVTLQHLQSQQQQQHVEEENVTMNDASEVDFPPLNNSQPLASTARATDASKWSEVASPNTEVRIFL